MAQKLVFEFSDSGFKHVSDKFASDASNIVEKFASLMHRT
jgi:hypothetical protein